MQQQYRMQETKTLYNHTIILCYQQDDRGLIPERDKWFSSSFQTTSEAHSAFFPTDTRGPFPGVKGGRVVTLTTQPPSSVEVNNE
jgi:hypothetical protein